MPEPADLRTCPRDLEILVAIAIPGIEGFLACPKCRSQYMIAGPSLINLTELRYRAGVGDDQVRAAISPDTRTTGTPIPVALDIAWSGIHRAWLELDGQVRGLMARLQNRAHFLHGELARQAMAHPELHPLVDTAKQIIDIVAARPDGIPNDGG